MACAMSSFTGRRAEGHGRIVRRLCYGNMKCNDTIPCLTVSLRLQKILVLIDGICTLIAGSPGKEIKITVTIIIEHEITVIFRRELQLKIQ